MCAMYLILCLISIELCLVSGNPLSLFECHGSCTHYKECDEAARVLKKSPQLITRAETDLLRGSVCGYHDGEAKVCCETVKTCGHRNLGLLPKDCGFVNGNRIIGGVTAVISEYPWMALISIRNKGGIGFACGGSVISDRYVLTAAHCVHNRQVMGVRIGEHNLATEPDCQLDTALPYCAEPVQDMAIKDIIVHEDYTNEDKIRKHDIALIRLKKRINFQYKNAQPVCLPTGLEEVTRNLDGLTGEVPGWGITDNKKMAVVLMKASVPILSRDECELIYEGTRTPVRFKTSTSTFLCAGLIGTDTCRGDSGGPLLLTGNHGGFTRYIQYGIVSFGPECGGERPSLYTDLLMHMPWILDKLEP